MGKYDDITPDELRTKLVRFSRLVLKLEEKGVLLEKSTALLKLMGELRQMIFAWEVRGTQGLESVQRWAEEREEEARARDGDFDGDPDDRPPGDPSDPAWLRESLRIVEESLRRQEELQDELGDDLFPDGDEDEE